MIVLLHSLLLSTFQGRWGRGSQTRPYGFTAIFSPL
jgi:hypothetical protein